MEVFRFVLHFAFHFFLPGLIAFVFFKKNWKVAWLLMILTMVIDLDHLIATPLYDSNRCSINFHPLHTYLAGIIYILLLVFNKTRIIGVGLILHLITDAIDCLFI